MMHGHEKSDLAIVAEKPANKAEQPTAEASTGASAAEPVERRAGTKGNAGQQSTCRAQNRISVSQALERIRQFAVTHPRWEPYAGKPHVRFCAGGRAMKRTSLPLRSVASAAESPRRIADSIGTLPQSMRRDFSGVSYDEAMRRASALVSVLRERAQRAEDARMLIRESEQMLHESGLFRFHQPKSFGGMELPFVAVVDIPAELARGCPSTAWTVGNVACHHWILGYYEPETQREVWEANPD